MRVLREWIRRVGATLRPDRRDDELAEELRLHMELVTADARRRGHDPDEAVRIARIAAGGSSQAMDALRDQRGVPWLEDAARDVSYGLRTLRRNPGFAATAILSLALGIGANTGIFSLVDQVLLRLLPVNDPDRLVLLNWRGNALSSQFGGANVLSYPLCRDLQEQTQFFDGVFCRAPATVNFSMGRQYETVRAEMVSGSYFSVLGVRAERGRLIGPSDDVYPGEHPVVVLSYDYWRNALGGADDVIGRGVFINGHPMTVIGVAAADFRGMDIGEPAGLWVPAMMARQATLELDRVLDRRMAWVHVFGRRKSGVTPEEAKTGLQGWFKATLDAETRHESFPLVTASQRDQFLASTIDVLPGAQGWSTLRGGLAKPLWALMIGTTLLLMLACLNVASLLLARGAERSQEFTTRMALGATHGRVARQLVVETLLIALAGGALGILAAPVVSRVLLQFVPEGVNLTPTLDHRILLYAFIASIVAGTLCGLAPAMQAARRPLVTSINGRSTATGTAVRFRKAIVAAQLAVTLVLLAGAGLFVQTLTRLHAKDRGFDSSTLLMFRGDPAGIGYSEADAPRVMRDVLRKLHETPNVERGAVANNSLLSGVGPSRPLTIESDRRIVTERSVPMMRVGPGFFSTLGAKVLAGREFEEHDTLGLEKTGARSVIVNESFARRYFGIHNPVGRRVGIGGQPETQTNIEIVGVVNDFSRRYLRDDADPEHIFFPFSQTGELAGDGTFYVRVRGDPESAFATIRAAIAEVDPRLPLTGLTTIEDQISRALRSERMLATLSTAFGMVALLLSVVGLFGVMSFVVAQRTQEIGMRLALGATRAAAIWLVIRDALMTIGAGIAVGTIAAVTVALSASSWFNTVLYGISPSDVGTFAATTTVLMIVALVACVAPAGRAAMLSPMVAIRDQPESMWHNARLKVRQAMRELATANDRAVAPGTLMSDVAGAVNRADSFPDAVQMALNTLRERVGARFILLLEKNAGGEYGSPKCAIPADGVLISRLRHYPHPLPLTADDFLVWERWAREFHSPHIAEIQRLAQSGARMAVPLRTKHELVAVLLLGPPEGAAPVETSEGTRNEFTAAQTRLLDSAADVFALLIENARLNERAIEQEKLRHDLALAAEVQRRLLPAQPPVCAAASFAAFTLPARTVGGDYYDFLDLADEQIGIAVADIAGKGIPAALLMSAVQASLRVMTGERDLPASKLAAQMNRFLYASTATSSYATFFYAQLDVRNRRLRYVNAGHNPPFLARRTDEGVAITDLTAGGTVLGLFPDVEYEDGGIDLRAGDLLLAYTDGVTEARNADGEEFGEERLKNFVCAAVGAPVEEISSTLTDRIREWIATAEQYDDITFVIAAVK
jgi:predicted permease